MTDVSSWAAEREREREREREPPEAVLRHGVREMDSSGSSPAARFRSLTVGGEVCRLNTSSELVATGCLLIGCASVSLLMLLLYRLWAPRKILPNAMAM